MIERLFLLLASIIEAWEKNELLGRLRLYKVLEELARDENHLAHWVYSRLRLKVFSLLK